MRYLDPLARLHDRFDTEAFREQLMVHLGRWGVIYALVPIGAAWFQANYAFGVNASPSLSYRLFLIHKNETPQRDEYVAFRWPGGGPYPAGITFVKQVGGVAGDVVTCEGREFFVNGRSVGHAKTRSRHGVLLDSGPTGSIPAAHYYVQAPHPDSLDSRYRLTGWIQRSQIIGRAYALF